MFHFYNALNQTVFLTCWFKVSAKSCISSEAALTSMARRSLISFSRSVRTQGFFVGLFVGRVGFVILTVVFSEIKMAGCFYSITYISYPKSPKCDQVLSLNENFQEMRMIWE